MRIKLLLLTCALVLGAATVAFTQREQKPNRFEISTPSLRGTVSVDKTTSPGSLADMTCRDMTVALINSDTKKEVMSEKVAGKEVVGSGGRCNFIFGSIPTGQPLQVQFRMTNPAKSKCTTEPEVILLDGDYKLPPFTKDQKVEKNYRVMARCKDIK